MKKDRWEVWVSPDGTERCMTCADNIRRNARLTGPDWIHLATTVRCTWEEATVFYNMLWDNDADLATPPAP